MELAVVDQYDLSLSEIHHGLFVSWDVILRTEKLTGKRHDSLCTFIVGWIPGACLLVRVPIGEPGIFFRLHECDLENRADGRDDCIADRHSQEALDLDVGRRRLPGI